MTPAMHDDQRAKYLMLLSEKFPTCQAVYTEVINLEAILNLPKATEHFISDVHGDCEQFDHIINNCSGVIRERVRSVFRHRLTPGEQAELCTLIYYPDEKLGRMAEAHLDTPAWYRESLGRLIELARYLSDAYTRSKVRKAMPVSYAYIIDELLHASPGEASSRAAYHARIVDSIIETGSVCDFIRSLAALIKRLAVDHVHVVGDLYDRGAHGDAVIDRLMAYHSLDIQWGNHDICWMGAAAGSEACVTTVVRNCVHYQTLDILEGSYGISLRELALFAEKTYAEQDVLSACEKAITVIMLKVSGQLISRHPEFDMADRLLLGGVDASAGTVLIGGATSLSRVTSRRSSRPVPTSSRTRSVVSWKDSWRASPTAAGCAATWTSCTRRAQSTSRTTTTCCSMAAFPCEQTGASGLSAWEAATLPEGPTSTPATAWRASPGTSARPRPSIGCGTCGAAWGRP